MVSNEKDWLIEGTVVFPKSWGVYLPGKWPPNIPRDDDLEMLERVRLHFQDRQGELLSIKFDLRPLTHKDDFAGVLRAMKRLWNAGVVFRFAKAIHTISGKPQYISYYIWGGQYEKGSGRNNGYTGGDSTATPIYFVQE